MKFVLLSVLFLCSCSTVSVDVKVLNASKLIEDNEKAEKLVYELEKATENSLSVSKQSLVTKLEFLNQVKLTIDKINEESEYKFDNLKEDPKEFQDLLNRKFISKEKLEGIDILVEKSKLLTTKIINDFKDFLITEKTKKENEKNSLIESSIHSFFDTNKFITFNDGEIKGSELFDDFKKNSLSKLLNNFETEGLKPFFTFLRNEKVFIKDSNKSIDDLQIKINEITKNLNKDFTDSKGIQETNKKIEFLNQNIDKIKLLSKLPFTIEEKAISDVYEDSRKDVYKDPLFPYIVNAPSSYWIETSNGVKPFSWFGDAHYVILRNGRHYSIHSSEFSPNRMIYATTNATMLAAEILLASQGATTDLPRFNEEGTYTGTNGVTLLSELKIKTSEVKSEVNQLLIRMLELAKQEIANPSNASSLRVERLLNRYNEDNSSN